MRIWKWKLKISQDQIVMMPAGAKVLDVQSQGMDDFYVWALCDEDAPEVERRFAVYGTGHKLPENPGSYISTFQLRGGTFVFHAFELTDNQE